MTPAKSRTRILLVAGDTTVQHLRALMLRVKGHEVTIAADLDEAEAHIASSGFHLVIVDVGHLPAAGQAFCEEIKKKYPHQKIIMQVDDYVFLDPTTCPDGVQVRSAHAACS